MPQKFRNKSYGLDNPLSVIFPDPIESQRVPTTSDLRFSIGQVWVDIPNDRVYMLTSIVNNLANWELIGGQGEIPITQYVVSHDGTGDYPIIQDAIDAYAASADTAGMIWVRPSTTQYIENLDFTNGDGLVIRGDNIQSIILGVHTPPATGAVIFQDLYLVSGTDIMTSAVVGATRLRFEQCTFNCTNGYIVDCANWTGPVDIFDCKTASTTDGIARLGASIVTINDSLVGAGTGNAFVVTGGTVIISNSTIECPISPATTTTTAVENSTLIRTFTTAGNTQTSLYNCSLPTGNTTAINHGSADYISVNNCNINTTADPAIAGAGAGDFIYSGIEFLENANFAGTLTLNNQAETRSAKLSCGDDTYRVDTFTGQDNVIQCYADDPTATGAATLNAMNADLTVSSGNGNHSPDAFQGTIDVIAGGNALLGFGVHGAAVQTDGSVIASTFAGVEGEVTIHETDVADLPQVYCFGVKGYYRTDDAAAVPATGEYAAIGAVTEYTTPLNDYGYGVVVTRLGAGAGTAARAAFGVAQGNQAIVDWHMGLDLYNTATHAGQPYSLCDIRFQNQSKLIAAMTGLTFTGDLYTRNIATTNTDITFCANPNGQSILDTGAAPSGATGATNILTFQEGVVKEEFIIGAGQTIIVPRMDNAGLLISLDLIATEGCEYNYGVYAVSYHLNHQFLIGTDAAFFYEVRFKVADVSGCEPLFMGFRTVGANDANYVNYNDIAGLGIITTQNADLITIADRQGGGVTYTNSTDAWTDGQPHTLRVNVSAGGVVTYLIDGSAPGATNPYTFTDAITVMPYISLKHAAVAPGAIHQIHEKCGYQAWV